MCSDLSGVDKRDAAPLFCASGTTASTKPAVGGRLPHMAVDAAFSTIPLYSIAQSNSAALLHSSRSPILRAGQAVPLRRCPAFWCDPCNRDNYVLFDSCWKQRLSIHAPSHIATKHSFRFPASHLAASGLHFSPGATGQQWQGSRFADNALYLASGRSTARQFFSYARRLAQNGQFEQCLVLLVIVA